MNNFSINKSNRPAKAATPQPPHIYLDNKWYIISAATYHHAHYLSTDEAKIIVRNKLKTLITEYHITLKAWVILNNHYHLLLRTHFGKDLTRFFQRLHGGTSFELNKLERKQGRKVWHNFWDTCIHSKRGFWTRFNYIHMNPIKHGYVTHLNDWPYSSYHYYRRTRGEHWLSNILKVYPVISNSTEDYC